jgi:hypothetical protein
MDRDVGLLAALASGLAAVPVDDDLDALRRHIWLSTDAAYKRAVSVFSKKKAAFQNRPVSEPVPDFSRETPVETILPVPGRSSASTRSWADEVRQISAVFAAHSEIEASDVVFSESRETRYFVNSEGFRAVVPTRVASVRVVAETLATDGMVLRDFFAVVSDGPDGLPPVADLVARTRELAAGLAAQRTAPAGDLYAGPVLVEGQAAAEVLLQTFVPLFGSRRPPDADDPRMTASAQAMVTPYLARLGSRVLPEWMTVAATPSLTRHEDRPVPGAFVVDDEGMRTQDVTLVEDGRLATLLTTRTPQRSLTRSNGHARAGNPAPGVFQVRSARGVPSPELRQKYLELLKAQGRPFGYLIRALANPGPLAPATFQTSGPMSAGPPGPGGVPAAIQILQAVRVTPDGVEQPVRGLQLGAVTHTAFRDLVEASSDRLLYSTRAPGGAVVSLIVPNLIFEELEIQKSRGVPQKPAVAPSPLKR